MNSIHIELVKAATISVAAAIPFTYLGLHEVSTRHTLGAADIAPVRNGTSTALGAVADAVDPAARGMAGLADTARPLTAAEDRWLRQAAVRSAKLVARGKLVKIQA